MCDLPVLTKNDLVILEQLTALGYIDNFDSSEHASIRRLGKIGMLDDSMLPSLVTTEMGSRTVYYSRALGIRDSLVAQDAIKCRIKGHSWWSGQPPWEFPLGCTPMAGYCRRCGVYTEYIGDHYNYLSKDVPRDESGRTVHIDYVKSEWRWL